MAMKANEGIVGESNKGYFKEKRTDCIAPGCTPARKIKQPVEDIKGKVEDTLTIEDIAKNLGGGIL